MQDLRCQFFARVFFGSKPATKLLNPMILFATFYMSTPCCWAHWECAGLSVFRFGDHWAVLIWPYILQTLPKIPDAPLFSNNPDRRSEVFQTINHDFKSLCNSFQQISLKDHPYCIHNMASEAHLEMSKKTRILLMWLWPARMVRGWRHTGWSWHQQVLSFRGCSEGTNTLIHWFIWEGWYFMISSRTVWRPFEAVCLQVSMCVCHNSF